MSDTRSRSLAGDAWTDLRHNKIFWASGVLVALILLMAVVPSLFTSADPAVCTLANQNQGPSSTAWFGYDFQGCDVFARTVYGTRDSLEVGLLSTLLAGVLGLIVGMAAGWFGGVVDAVLSRLTDIMLGVPLLLAAVVFSGRLSSPFEDGVFAVTLTLGLLTWTAAARVMRSAVITAKSQDYVAAARMLGAGPARLVFRHVLPNSIASFIVVITILLGTNIAAEATLSYLGAGLGGDAISWGLQIAEARNYARIAASPLVWPSVFLAVTVLAFIMLGDAIRDAFDPKLR
ncbi:ABC transporter permease [Actinoplanes couchii]|uniref:ABC transporter permease n=1 Tax=Actinoplanes couchii TaxID=403638 RepID=A0ABQ3XC25_9ACTN|nr:ABC transporter permease [Actinoplanes couchii]MDR6323513.1 ABC-type dipeptide/oligopeptide/nickel transport system permease subunit [Actinoplanes couchii]GID56029.1 ABC transporter permease [Actinoplanes couchii]